MDRLDPRVLKRIGGPTWEKVRPQIDRINEALLGVSPVARGDLTTVYVKYTAPPQEQPFAVLWLKKSTELVLGLALPEGPASAGLAEPARPYIYAGLTAYLIVEPQDRVPDAIDEWASRAYENVMGNTQANADGGTNPPRATPNDDAEQVGQS